MENLIFLGDFYYDYSEKREDIEHIFREMGDDSLIIANLEGPICNKNEKKIEKRGPNLVQSEQAIQVLKEANVYAVCLANNHMMDYGEEGLCNTIACLDKAGIKHVGAGKNIDLARQPIVIENNGQKYVLINFAWEIEETIIAQENKAGCAPRDEKIIIHDISHFADKGMKPIVIMHWGFEYNLHPQPRDISLAHKMIDVGAEIVIGHHPHVTQGWEEYKGKKIFYSIGNFYFSGKRDEFQDKFRRKKMEDHAFGLIVDYNIRTKLCSLKKICYNDCEKRSEISVLEDNELYNYTNMKIDRYYIKKLIRNKRNFNPVLYDNFWAKVQLLFFQYVIRKYVRNLVRLFTVRKN